MMISIYRKKAQMNRWQQRMSSLVLAGVIALGSAGCAGDDDGEEDDATQVSVLDTQASSTSNQGPGR
jgi:hypothetical protein